MPSADRPPLVSEDPAQGPTVDEVVDLAALHPAPVLAADGLRLEPLRVGHAEEMASVLDDARLHTWIGGSPAGVERLRAQYAVQTRGRSADGRQVWLNWVVRSTDDGAALGYVQATVDLGPAPAEGTGAGGDDEEADAPVAHVAWVVGVPHQGAGVATRAAAAMVAWLRSRGVERFVADVHPGNAASQAVARSLGLVASDEVVDGEVRWVSPPSAPA